MSKRANLPYSYQDLFPRPSGTPRDQSTPASISGASFAESLRTGPHHLTPARNIGSSTTTWMHFKKLFKRLTKPRTLDFETAIWEVFNLIVNPRKMYRSNYTYKNGGKSSYSRDDPSFLILLTGFLSVSAVAWGITYSPKITDVLKLILTMVFFDFYVSGVVIATISWIVSNKLFNPTFNFQSFLSRDINYSINYIDWAFCFDVHSNSFLIIWCLLYLVQFFMLPLLTRKDSFLSLLLGNTLYFGAIGHYFVVTFYGFNSLPFVNHSLYARTSPNASNPAKILQMTILTGILPILAFVWLLTVITHFNVALFMVNNYFN